MSTLTKVVIFLLVCLAIALIGCTPEERNAWLQWEAVDPVAANVFRDTYIAEHAAEVAVEAIYGQCGEWHDLAISVGWPEDHWTTLNRVMFGESNCLATAYNRSGATGLLQIMPGWAPKCGGVQSDLFDPTFNLSCGLLVLAEQGWTAWSAY